MATPDKPAPLIHCIYASAASHAFEPAALAQLLMSARVNNAALGLTGMLLYTEGCFFQVLEGPDEVVDTLYRKIEGDPRHMQVTRIIREPIHKRSFDAWTMGFCQATPQELADMSGVNDFFTSGRTRPRVDSGRARKLLDAFAAGRWRLALHGASQSA